MARSHFWSAAEASPACDDGCPRTTSTSRAHSWCATAHLGQSRIVSEHGRRRNFNSPGHDLLSRTPAGDPALEGTGKPLPHAGPAPALIAHLVDTAQGDDVDERLPRTARDVQAFEPFQ